MKHATKIICYIFLFVIGIPALALAGSATLHWQANTEPDLAGYRIYYGTSSRSYGPYIPVDKNTTSYTINNLTEGQTYYFALTAVDTSGNESGYSQEVSKTIQIDDTMAPFGYLDAPREGEIIAVGNVAIVGGWALDDTGISRVEIYIDGAKVGDATYGALREDVFNVFPGYNNHNAGYNWEWDTSGYSIGEHEIFARYVDNAGNVVDVGRRTVRIVGE